MNISASSPNCQPRNSTLKSAQGPLDWEVPTKTPSKLKLKLFYSQATHYKLNYLTLRLKDKEIEKEYLEARATNFDAHFHKVLGLSIVYVLFRLV